MSGERAAQIVRDCRATRTHFQCHKAHGQIVHCRGVHDIARVEGPERIAPEWWRQASSARLRDYYRVEDSEGRRYWIYREGLIGDGRGGLPNWYIHGLFG